MLSKLLKWCFLVAILCVAHCGFAVQPAGTVYILPGELWADETGTTDTEVQLMLPQKLDEQGTLTIVGRVDFKSRLLRLEKDAVPSALGFLFGESEELYVRILPGRDSYNLGLKDNEVVIHLPYDRSPSAHASRKFKLLDLDGNLVRDFKVEFSLRGRFKAYRTPYKSAEIDKDGVVVLPNVIDLIHSEHLERTMPTELYDIRAVSNSTGQVYVFDLLQFSSTPITQIWLPFVQAGSSKKIMRTDATIRNFDGSPNSNTTVTLATRHRAPGRDEIMTRLDPEAIYVNNLLPGPDGKLRIEFTPEFSYAVQNNSLSALIVQHNEALFPDTRTLLPIGGHANIQVTQRLDLTATLIRADGRHIDANMQAWTPDYWGGIKIRKINPDCKYSRQDNMAFRGRNTTGVAILLKGLPVPGKYLLENRDRRYGPLEIGVTSPTEILKFHEADEKGVLRGLVVDEQSTPLKGALVAVVKDESDFKKLKDLGHLATDLVDVPTSLGLQRLCEITSGVLTYTLTNNAGEYHIPRKCITPSYFEPMAMVMAPDRIPAFTREFTPECLDSLAEDLELPTIHLPRITYAVGSISPPDVVPDTANPGEMKNVNLEDYHYQVEPYRSWAWFNQYTPESNSYWQYDANRTTFTIGQSFRAAMPIGTSVSLRLTCPDLPIAAVLTKARTVNSPLKEVNYTTITMRQQRPFKLIVKYADGKPASGLVITLDQFYKTIPVNGRQLPPITDQNGEIVLYSDYNSWTPNIHIRSRYRTQASESFKPRRLPVGEKLPIIPLELSADKWQVTEHDSDVVYN